MRIRMMTMVACSAYWGGHLERDGWFAVAFIVCGIISAGHLKSQELASEG